jgi:hypothetical protein
MVVVVMVMVMVVMVLMEDGNRPRRAVAREGTSAPTCE